MTEIEVELRALKIPFDVEGDRIRCFPHVVNIAVKTGLKHLTELPAFDPDIVLDDEDMPVPQSLRDNLEYWDALKLDPVGSARKLVTACRGVIVAGNEAGGWGDPPEQLRVVGLLKDVETRWSATFLMIDRLLEQCQAVDKFLGDPKQAEIAYHALDAVSLQVLQDIRRFLQVPHIVQEIVSAEKTPTLSIVLPMYERLIVMLRDLAKDLDVLSHAINATIKKLEEYLGKSRRTKIYSLAMALNPTIKLKWLRDHWDYEDYTAAKESVRASSLRAENKPPAPAIPTSATRRVVQPPSISHAARSQAHGLARLNKLAKSLSGSDFESPAPSTPATELTEAEKEEAARIADLEDRRLTGEELEQYEAEGVIAEGHPEFEDFDLLRYWECRLRLFLAKGCSLPARKLMLCGVLSPTVMEMLQILKFIYRSGRFLSRSSTRLDGARANTGCGRTHSFDVGTHLPGCLAPVSSVLAARAERREKARLARDLSAAEVQVAPADETKSIASSSPGYEVRPAEDNQKKPVVCAGTGSNPACIRTSSPRRDEHLDDDAHLRRKVLGRGAHHDMQRRTAKHDAERKHWA
ncbi:ribonuclease H-like domain-containing protein [Mycena galericulata]|nr:ribonuclease H-like domain-containing protein [Mycena galericulata]